MMRKIQRIAIAFFLICLPVFVNAAYMEPQDLVMSVADQTLERIKKDKDKIKAEPLYVNELIDELVLPHFDFERMSRWVLGKHWRKATDDQKKRFIAEFKNLLVRTYANSLLEYSDQKIEYLPFRGSPADEEVTVRSEIAQPGGFPIPITYKLYKPGADWKVFDVLIDEVSLVSNYRTSFSREIRNGSIDALIKKLADKNK